MYGNHITHKIFDMTGTKKEEIPIELMRDVQAVVSKRENYPLLIHCNHGKHRTGCVIGVFRKCNMWDTERIIDEYRSFAAPKVRETDLKYLKEFKLTSLLLQPQPRILPGTLVRFCRFVVVVALALFTFYPLGQLRLQTPGPKLV
jgi:tyrosine-protein phosphatase SIW14